MMFSSLYKTKNVHDPSTPVEVKNIFQVATASKINIEEFKACLKTLRKEHLSKSGHLPLYSIFLPTIWANYDNEGFGLTYLACVRKNSEMLKLLLDSGCGGRNINTTK